MLFLLLWFCKKKNALLRAGMTAEVDFTFEGVGKTGFQGVGY